MTSIISNAAKKVSNFISGDIEDAYYVYGPKAIGDLSDGLSSNLWHITNEGGEIHLFNEGEEVDSFPSEDILETTVLRPRLFFDGTGPPYLSFIIQALGTIFLPGFIQFGGKEQHAITRNISVSSEAAFDTYIVFENRSIPDSPIIHGLVLIAGQVYDIPVNKYSASVASSSNILIYAGVKSIDYADMTEDGRIQIKVTHIDNFVGAKKSVPTSISYTSICYEDGQIRPLDFAQASVIGNAASLGGAVKFDSVFALLDNGNVGISVQGIKKVIYREGKAVTLNSSYIRGGSGSYFSIVTEDGQIKYFDQEYAQEIEDGASIPNIELTADLKTVTGVDDAVWSQPWTVVNDSNDVSIVRIFYITGSGSVFLYEVSQEDGTESTTEIEKAVGADTIAPITEDGSQYVFSDTDTLYFVDSGEKTKVAESVKDYSVVENSDNDKVYYIVGDNIYLFTGTDKSVEDLGRYEGAFLIYSYSLSSYEFTYIANTSGEVKAFGKNLNHAITDDDVDEVAPPGVRVERLSRDTSKYF